MKTPSSHELGPAPRSWAKRSQLRRNFEDSPLLYVPKVYGLVSAQGDGHGAPISGLAGPIMPACSTSAPYEKARRTGAFESSYSGVSRQLLPWPICTGQYFGSRAVNPWEPQLHLQLISAFVGKPDTRGIRTTWRAT